MNYFYNYMALLMLTFTVTTCGSLQEKKTENKQYQITTDAPFSITEVYYQKWVAGVQEGGSGTNIFIKFDLLNDNIEILNMYFHNQVAPLKQLINNPKTYQSNLKKNTKNTLIMDGDSTKEINNRPPLKMPFNLKENDAVLSYREKGQLKYYKISALPEKPTIAYPSVNPNNKQ